MGSNNVRDIIFYKIKEHIEDKDFYVLNADLIGRPLIEIKKEYPDRFIQAGIAEQNMIAMACGLALEGKRPVTYSPNPFEYLRAYDQIRNAVCSMNLPVVMVANGIGFVNPGLGITHLTTEDYQLFSLCPGLKIITVSDERVAESVAEYILSDLQSPVYVGIDFNCDGILPACEDVDMQKGFRYIRKGKKKLIVSMGYSVRTALESDNDTAIVDVFSRPFDFDKLWAEMERYDKVVVLEEHQFRGGLGSELLEKCYKAERAVNFKILAIEYGDRLPQEFGSRDWWTEKYHVDKNAVESSLR